ncbi:MAG: hypothetical protein JW861_05080 [Bacteroidales bacterium]|nr:hypothetical protein [Bacteroidales bacterium]
MLMLQLIIFAFLFLVFGVFSAYRKKKLLGAGFIITGILLLAIGLLVLWLYPQSRPF